VRSQVPIQTQIDEEWARLSVESRELILDGNLNARLLATRPDRNYWLKVGRAMARLREEALHRSGANHDQHPIYRRFFRILLRRVPDLEALYEQDKPAMVAARWLADSWLAVESFLAGLARDDARTEARLNHPLAIKRRFEDADRRRPQGLEKPATPLQRKDARIAELESELDTAETELRRLTRGQDNLTEGRDWTWQDNAKDIAAAWFRLYPTKAAQVASEVMQLAKSTTSKPRASAGRGKRQTSQKSERDWDE
jgi:hypothetical protein